MNSLGHDYNDYGQEQMDILLAYNAKLNEAGVQPTSHDFAVQVSEFNWVYVHADDVAALTAELDGSMQ